MSFLNGAFFIVAATMFCVHAVAGLCSVGDAVDGNRAKDAIGYFAVAMLHTLLMGWSVMAASEWWAP